jgi:hypothetical protein
VAEHDQLQKPLDRESVPFDSLSIAAGSVINGCNVSADRLFLADRILKSGFIGLPTATCCMVWSQAAKPDLSSSRIDDNKKKEMAMNKNGQLLDCPEENKYDTSKCQGCGLKSDYVGHLYRGQVIYSARDTGKKTHASFVDSWGKMYTFTHPTYDCSVSIPYRSVVRIPVGICDACVAKNKKGDIQGGIGAVCSSIIVLALMMFHLSSRTVDVLAVVLGALLCLFLAGVGISLLHGGLTKSTHYEDRIRRLFAKGLADAPSSVVFGSPLPNWLVDGHDYSKNIKLDPHEMFEIGTKKGMNGLVFSSRDVIRYLSDKKKGLNTLVDGVGLAQTG